MAGLFAGFVRVLVEFRPRRREAAWFEVPSGATVRDLCAIVGQPADTVVVVRGSEPIAETEVVRDGESLLVLSAFSGG